MTLASPQRAQQRILQTSFVVRDVYETAQAFLDVYSIGPWFIFEHYPFKDLKYRGSVATMDVTIAVSYSGTLMIELIQQHDDAPSAYKEVVAAHGYGFHHFAIPSHDYDKDLARYRKLGFEVVNEATAPGDHGDHRAAYLDTSARLPGLTELMETVPDLMAALKELETTAADWDGTEPIRVHKFR